MASRLAQITAMMNRSPALFAGSFLSGIFLLLGVIGTLAFGPRLLAWHDAATWPTTEGTVLGGDVASSRGRRGGRLVRPVLRYEYDWQGKHYSGEGYELLEAYTNNYERATRIVSEHPAGSRLRLMVNPANPAQAVVERGGFSSLVIVLVPPLFALLGLVGGIFCVAGGLGWLDPGSRHPFGLATRAVGSVLLREGVLKAIFWVGVSGTIVGLVVVGILDSSPLLFGVAAFVAWGTWVAARPRGKKARSGTGRR